MEPITRKENWYARIAGDAGAELTPVTREEFFLQRIAETSGGGGGSDEPLIVTLTPTNPLNPLGGGTHNASEADLSAAWASGRKIRAVISGVAEFDLSSFVANPDVYTCNFVYAASETDYVLVHAFIRANAGSYGCNIFALTSAM